MSFRKKGSLAVESCRLNLPQTEAAVFLVRLFRALSNTASGVAIMSLNTSLMVVYLVLLVDLCCLFFLFKGEDAEISVLVGGESVREPENEGFAGPRPAPFEFREIFREHGLFCLFGNFQLA